MIRKKQIDGEASTTKPIRASRSKKVAPQNTSEDVTHLSINDILQSRTRLKCKNSKQKDFVRLIDEKDVVFAYGPAGTGKSYTAIAKGIELLQNYPEKYTSLKIIKPAVDTEENYGFLPGSLKEKLEPYLASSIDIVDKIIGVKNRTTLETLGVISVEPLGFVRGKTLDNTILIVEEAQNMTPMQMKTVLTRIGENSKFIVSGDLDQSDKYKDITHSGLYDALRRFRNIRECGFLEFEMIEIVRHPIIGKFLTEYNKDYSEPKKIIKIEPNKVIKSEPTIITTSDKKSFFEHFKW